MLKPYDPFANEPAPVPPECRATVERIQHALDGALTIDSLEAEPHAGACPACRERVRAARLLLAALAQPREPVAVPPGFSDRVVTAMWEDRHARTRQRVFRAAGVLAVAAGVLIAVFAIVSKPQRDGAPPLPLPIAPPGETVQKPEVAPPPRAKEPAPAPAPPPVRIGEQFAKAGEKLLEAPKPLTDSVAVAPKLFDAITSPFKLPEAPANPMGNALEPARQSLTEFPTVARTGLEPVTGTAEKAFARFLRDVGAVKPNS